LKIKNKHSAEHPVDWFLILDDVPKIDRDKNIDLFFKDLCKAQFIPEDFKNWITISRDQRLPQYNN